MEKYIIKQILKEKHLFKEEELKMIINNKNIIYKVFQIGLMHKINGTYGLH